MSGSNPSSDVEGDVIEEDVSQESEAREERAVHVLDNSGDGRIKVPGFHDIPIFYQQDPSIVFTHGAGGSEEYNPDPWNCAPASSWEQKPRLTARELAMINLMNLITDRESWNLGLLDEEVIADWRKEALSLDLISEKTWDWCLMELQDKANSLSHSVRRRTLVLDTGSCICKSDNLMSLDVRQDFQRYTALLLQGLCSERVRRAGRTILVNPDSFPLIRGRTPVLIDGGCINLEDISASFRDGVAAPLHPDHSTSLWGSIANDEEADISEYDGTDSDASMDRLSTKFQWLPCEVSFVSQENDDTEKASFQIRIRSYINNLHPDHTDLYRVIEELITVSIEPWNDCLIYGNCPRIPMRIRTYGTGPKNFEHPEPGTSFSYDDWKAGNTSNVIVSGCSHEYTDNALRDLNHEFYSIKLQDYLHLGGLQVVVQISNIELDPTCPSYDGEPWHVSGFLNDHIVATSIYFFDVVNIL